MCTDMLKMSMLRKTVTYTDRLNKNKTFDKLLSTKI